MSTPDHYRAKAQQYWLLAKSSSNAEDVRGYRLRAASLTTLADNAQWLSDHRDETLQAPSQFDAKHSDQPTATEDSNDASEGGVRGQQPLAHLQVNQ